MLFEEGYEIFMENNNGILIFYVCMYNVTLKIFFFIYPFEKANSYPLFHFPNACSGPGLANPLPASHVGIRKLATSGVIAASQGIHLHKAGVVTQRQA